MILDRCCYSTNIISNPRRRLLSSCYIYYYLIPFYNQSSLTAVTAFSTSSNNSISTIPKMDDNDYSKFRVWDDGKDIAIRNCIYPLLENNHKGSSGRIGIIGGSERYTGAPYYSAMSTLLCGSDLITLYTAYEATTPIKSYSPELMVQSIYNANTFNQYAANNKDNETLKEQEEKDIQYMVNSVIENLNRLHCLIIGPGMGRCPIVMKGVVQIIKYAREHNIYMIFDADGLYLLSQPQYRNLLHGYTRAILTPNVMEYKRLYPEEEGTNNDNNIDDPFASVMIVKKGKVDEIIHNGNTILSCHEQGGLKRSGGIGDILSGVIGTMIAWYTILHHNNNDNNNNINNEQCNSNDNDNNSNNILALSCWTACCIVKKATKSAFDKKKRSMLATDILNELGTTFDKMMY